MSDAQPDTQAAKLRAAQAAARLVTDGMIVGLGSGTTAALVVQALGERVADEGLRLIGVPTSVLTADLARSLGIRLRDLDDVEAIDLNLDGADEIDPQFSMVKGRGGALLREKIVASSARRRVTVVTADKCVARLGVAAAIPVEISNVGARHTEARLRELGATTAVRLRVDASPFLTDGGNKIIDCHFDHTEDARTLDARLHQTVGVLETGLFVGLCDLLIVGHPDGVEQRPAPDGVRAASG